MTALDAFLAHIIDYAGLFPPAALSLEETCANYGKYLASPEAWMLNRLVLPITKLRLGEGWRISALVDAEPGPLPEQVETLETRLPHRLSLPTYCEAPLAAIQGGWAKIRTAEATSQQVADFLCLAATMRLPFKATAGLHHAIRSHSMHGFLNVFAAAAFAWYGAERAFILDMIDDQDARAFEFSEDGLRWRGHTLSTAQIAEARRDFVHSFGSCSFEDPIADLRTLGLLK